jgi:hypothetical protein
LPLLETPPHKFTLICLRNYVGVYCHHYIFTPLKIELENKNFKDKKYIEPA